MLHSWWKTTAHNPLTVGLRRGMPVAYYGNGYPLVMSMGNYLRGKPVLLIVMAASDQSLGVDHPTIVPTNFEPDVDSASRNDETAEEV